MTYQPSASNAPTPKSDPLLWGAIGATVLLMVAYGLYGMPKKDAPPPAAIERAAPAGSDDEPESTTAGGGNFEFRDQPVAPRQNYLPSQVTVDPITVQLLEHYARLLKTGAFQRARAKAGEAYHTSRMFEREMTMLQLSREHPEVWEAVAKRFGLSAEEETSGIVSERSMAGVLEEGEFQDMFQEQLDTLQEKLRSSSDPTERDILQKQIDTMKANRVLLW